MTRLGGEPDAFTDLTRNRAGADAVKAGEACVHRGVKRDGAAAEFSRQRNHPVFPVRVPARTLSASIGVLEPGSATRDHRHAYEAIMFVLAGRGYSIVDGVRLEWAAGDAVYTPPWCWHQHVADPDCRVEYITATNMPLLEAVGQTHMRDER